MKTLLLVGACKGSKAKSNLYEWTARQYPLQAEYLRKNEIVDKLFWVEDNVYDPKKNDEWQMPELILGNPNPLLLEPESPHRTRLEIIHTDIDGEFEIESSGPAAMFFSDPIIATPEGREVISIRIEAEIMMLLPMDPADFESRATIVGWRPQFTNLEFVDLRLVRNEEGDTKLELVIKAGQSVEIVVDLPYSQWDLLKERQSFELKISEGEVAVFVDDIETYRTPNPAFKQGDGFTYFFDRVHGFQSFSIARIHAVRIERAKEAS